MAKNGGNPSSDQTKKKSPKPHGYRYKTKNQKKQETKPKQERANQSDFFKTNKTKNENRQTSTTPKLSIPGISCKPHPIETKKKTAQITPSNEIQTNPAAKGGLKQRGRRRKLTREIPRLALADIDLGDDIGLAPDLPRDLPLEVVPDELLVGGVEPEPERQLLELHHRHLRPLIHLPQPLSHSQDPIRGRREGYT
jgi:hypothetical protein